MIPIRALQVCHEPVPRELSDLIQRSGLLEEMRRVRHHHQLLFAAQPHQRLAIQLQHHFVSAAHESPRVRRDIQVYYPIGARKALDAVAALIEGVVPSSVEKWEEALLP